MFKYFYLKIVTNYYLLFPYCVYICKYITFLVYEPHTCQAVCNLIIQQIRVVFVQS